MYLEHYLQILGYDEIPLFLKKYLNVPSLLRLKKISYFCGMDYASKDIYNFREYISRYDHSLTVSLLTYKLTHDKVATLAGLFHDIATPCFSHVIDYMNGDYLNQESTELYTEKILRDDYYLNKYLLEDDIDINDIIDFKSISIVDNDRPKLCADRLDGIILTGISWTKNISIDDIDKIINDITVYKNDEEENEIGFKTFNIAKLVEEINDSIDIICHSNEDNYMMDLLAKITKLAIDKKYITYDDLFTYGEKELLKVFKNANDNELNKLINTFENIKLEEVPVIKLPDIKARKINPIVKDKRI